jgi:hypothetical protein
MNLKTMTAQLLHTDHAMVITVKNYSTSVTLAYGAVVIKDATNDDLTQAMPGVAVTTSADLTTVCGVICEPGGIAPGATGRMVVYGFADVTVVSGSYAAGAYLGTSTTSGAAATGTYARGSGLGTVWGNAGGTVTTTVAFIHRH